MPVFECSRCNDMTYSSSTGTAGPCPACGAERRRLVSDAASFAEAKRIPRAVSYGDHSIAVFDEVGQVVPIATQFIDQALLAGGLMIAAVSEELTDAILDTMHPDDHHGVAWEPASDTYGPTFSPETVIDRFREIAELEERPVFVLGCADEPIQDFTSLADWMRYERMAHELAVEFGMTVLCLYDARVHDERMLRAGLKTHGLKLDDGELLRNEEFDYEPPA